jgi:GH24 family phage-related lysozyme (muramidase)
MNQKNSYVAKAAGVLFMAIAAVVTVHEGRSLVAYKDSAGVLTICDGDTKDVRAGQKATPAQCDDRLRRSITEHAKGLDGLPAGLPDVVVLGSVDFTYNIGVQAMQGSSTYSSLLLRDYSTAGLNVLKWKYITVNGKKYDCSQLVHGAPNKVCYGLWLRRQWQARAIGNQFSSVQEALQALPK